MLKVLLLMLFLCVTNVTSFYTFFNITLNFDCDIGLDSVYKIKVLEEDLLRDDLLVCGNGTINSTTGHFKTFTADYTDYSSEYELAVEILHNCSTDGLERKIYQRLGDFKKDKKTYYITKDVNLYNKGGMPDNHSWFNQERSCPEKNNVFWEWRDDIVTSMFEQIFD